MTKKIRILFADDNKAFRDGLKRLLEAQPQYQVVGEAIDGEEAVAKAISLLPDVAILDYSMPKLDGLSAAYKIRQAAPSVETLLLTQHDAPYTAQRAIDAGVRGFVVKSDASRDLLPAIDAVRQQKTFVSSTIARGFSGGSISK